MRDFRQDAERIAAAALKEAQPDRAVKKALGELRLAGGRVVLIAVGKAAWQMAQAAQEQLGGCSGVVITKYGHSRGPLPGLEIREAGHPVPDENSFRATEAAIRAVAGLTGTDTVLLLLSGGGSALFEQPLIPMEELQAITARLLACGADIVEINTIRKRLSGVKGGKFARLCAPARVITVALSDVLGDRADMIASGPGCPDPSTSAEALTIASRYGLKLSQRAEALLKQETPKKLPNAEIRITGSVRQLCRAAEAECRALGYEPVILTDCLSCQAREAGVFLGTVAKTWAGTRRAWIAGGETVVKLQGDGLGGRNQELALAGAEGLAGLEACLFSLGSDGTDGPTDAAGGYVDGNTLERLQARGIDVREVLDRNDSYHALASCGGLIVTGPTGTNVNDLTVLLT